MVNLGLKVACESPYYLQSSPGTEPICVAVVTLRRKTPILSFTEFCFRHVFICTSDFLKLLEQPYNMFPDATP